MSTKIAIVTGGNSGLGFATAKKLCDNGIKTFIVGRTKEKTEDACTEIGPNAVPVIFDLNNLEEINNINYSIQNHFSLNLIIHNIIT